LRSDRGRFLDRLQPVLARVGAEIAPGEEIALAYRQGVTDLAGSQTQLRHDLARLHGRERLLGQTLVGPHRDDPELLVAGRPLKLFGSQGQMRSFLLAFKAAQLIDLEAQLGEPPLLLLDDLASELDAERQASFFAFLRQRRGQVLITTTHPATLGPAVCPQARYYRVEQGSITENHAV
jgi:DNA replication and repair protein RecF